MEFLKNLINPVTERVRSPFYGTFIISWLLVNWRIILALFSSNDKIDDLSKFKFIENQLSNYQLSILFPILFALSYLLIIPWIEYLFYNLSEYIKRLKVKSKIKIMGRSPVSGEEYIKLYNLLLDKEESLAKVDTEVSKRKAEVMRQEFELLKIKDEKLLLERDLKEKDNTINKYTKRGKLDEIFIGEWEHSYRINSNQNYETPHILVVDSSNKQFQLKNGGSSFSVYGQFDYVDIDPDGNTVKFIFSSDNFYEDFQRISLNKDITYTKNQRYIGNSHRGNGVIAEIYFQKIL